MELLSLDQYALDRHGLVVKATAGIPHSTWYRWVRGGRLEILHPGVARLVGTPRTHTQRTAAAVWSLGGSALASHRSAAHLHRLIDADGAARSGEAKVDVILPGRSRQRSLVGVSCHRPTDSIRLAPHRIDGIRCTNLPRTLVDLGSVAPDEVSGAVGIALSLGW